MYDVRGIDNLNVRMRRILGIRIRRAIYNYREGTPYIFDMIPQGRQHWHVITDFFWKAEAKLWNFSDRSTVRDWLIKFQLLQKNFLILHLDHFQSGEPLLLIAEHFSRISSKISQQ